jgi:hypothetical protein
VARHCAGILCAIAFAAIVIRGLARGVEIDQTLYLAILSLVLFSIVGWLLKQPAGRVALQSARSQLSAAKSNRHASRAGG